MSHIAKGLLIALALLTVLVVAVVVGLRLKPVQDFAKARIVAGIGDAIHQRLTVGSAEGEWPNHIVLSQVAVADATGIWLTVDHLDLRWNAGALLHGDTDIDALSAGTVQVLRLPAGQGGSGAPDLAGLRRNVEHTRVGALAIETLRLEAPVLGRPGAVGVAGALTSGNEHLLTLALTRRDAAGNGRFALRLPPGGFALESHVALAGVTLDGDLSLDQATRALAGKLAFVCGDGAPCLQWPEGQLGKAAITATVAGTLTAPTADAALHAENLRDGNRAMAALDGRLAVAPQGDVIGFNGEGAAAGLDTALPEIGQVLAKDSQWSLRGEVQSAQVRIQAVEIHSGDSALTLTGALDGNVLSAAKATLTLARAGRLLGLADPQSVTHLDLDIARLTFSPFTIAGRLAAEIDNPPPGMTLAPLARGPLRFTAAAAGDAAHLAFSEMRGTFGATGFTGASNLARGQHGLDHSTSHFALTIAPRTISGIDQALQGDVQLAGGFAALSVKLNAPLALSVAGAPLDGTLSASAQEGAHGLWQGDARLEGQWRNAPLALAAAFAQPTRTTLALNDVHALALGANLDGKLTVDLDRSLVEGALAGKVADLAPLAAPAGIPITGTGNLAGAFTNNNGRQRFTLNLTAGPVSGPVLAAESLSIQGVADDLWRIPALSLQVKANDGAVAGRAFSEATISAAGPSSALAVRVAAKGRGAHKFTVDAAATVSLARELDIALERLVLEDGIFNAKLLAPTRFSYTDAAATLAPTRISTDGGAAEARFAWDRKTNRIDAAAKLDKIVLGDAARSLPGAARSEIDGELTLSGDARGADADGHVTAHYTAKDEGNVDVTATLNASVRQGRAKLTGSATGLSAEDAHLAADIPLRLDVADTRIALDMNAPLSGSLNWRGEIAPLWRIVALDQHLLAGAADVNVNVTGSFDQPKITGGLQLAKGRYENLSTGTVLRNLEATLAAAEGAALTIKAAGNDSDNGRVTAQGSLKWDESLKTWVVDAGGDLDRFHVLRRDDVIVAATGHMTYKGPADSGTLSGRLQVVRSEYRLGASYVPEIPLLRTKAAGQPHTTDRPSAVQLDVRLAIDDVLRTEGKGLEAFWRGELTASGAIDKPDVVGTLTLARGTFTFLGQTFDLDTGTVTFTGGGAIDPELAISAARASGDVTATVAISGRASAPKIALSSVPALPQDEVLAQLLFRKGATQLGPQESLQLASAAADLAGLSQGGLTGMLRRTFGLDIVGFGGKSGDSVVLGHQFSSALYVGVEQSVGTKSDRQLVVEWRLSRTLSVQSTTTEQAGADLGLIWRKNY